jgi:uncharacterized repeat protein (TIGR01451 family)
MAAQFVDDPNCPVDARTILTYSQSTNPDSPYFADQTRMFSNKEWVNEAYCESEIAADPNLEVQRLSSVPAADLAVTNSDSPDPVSVGGRITYTVTVTNNGPDPASSVSLTDQLDRSVRLSSARSTDGRCRLKKRGSLTCNMGSLGVDEQATATISVRTNRRGAVVNTASVAASDPAEFDPTNNIAVATTTVTP